MYFYKPNEYQNAMLNIEHIYPCTSVCCIGGIMPFDNTVNKDMVIKAAKEVVRLTPAIRLRFDAEERLYVSEEPAVLEELNLPEVSDNTVFAEKLMHEPINLINSPLYQFKYITTSTGEFGFMKIHHILGDHAALLVFFRELEKIYFQLENGTYTQQEPDTRYIENGISEYIQDFGASEAYYKKRIEQFDGELTGYKLRSTASGVFRYKLTDKESEQILTFCKTNSIKPESVFYAGLAFYQKKTTGAKDAIFGRVLMNRGRREINVFGLYANTIPIFIRAIDDFVSVCKRASAELLESVMHSSYPLNRILADNGLKERCFNMAVSFISAGLMPKFKMAEPQKIFNGNIELPMRLHIMHKKQTIEFHLEYAKELYSEASAEAFIKSLLCIIDTGIKGMEPECRTEDDKRSYENLNDVKYLKAESTVSRMFSEYARKHSSETAVVFDGEALSFGDVENMANVIAEAVSGCKVVGISMGRCKYFVPAMLGVLKAGGAYMPLAPNANPPPECDVILTLSQLEATDSCQTVLVDKLNYSSPEYRDFSKQASEAYLMRTSGSSGVPKTVKISNASLYLRLKWMHDEYSLSRRILQKTNAGFDVSGWELLCGAFGGCCIMVKDGDERDLAAICRYIDSFEIEMIHFVPSMLRLFLKYIEKGSHTSLKKVISSGEALDAASVKLFYEKLPDAVLYNLYGPTECTIDVTSYCCTGNEEIIPIGKPVYNTGIHIVLPCKEVAPRGVKGEIVVTGELVGMGYTQTTGGYGDFKGERAYYTGDIGYLGFDGYIYYCGRKDSQVKMSGKRMDLAETERFILSIDGVSAAAAIYDGGRVFAYYSADEPIDNIMACMAKLTERLPAAFIYVKNMPFSASGKINRTALIKLKPETNSAPPSNETERIILETAEAELNQGEIKVSIGVEDNLFDAGLDSLAALSFMIRLEEQGFSLTVQDIYANPTVRMLAARENTPRPLVRLSGRKSDKALCCFPYAGGEPQAFAKIAEEYENETLAVNYDFFDDKSDIEKIAKQVCEALKERSEIRIAASCAGSAAALETAVKLEATGVKIDGIYIMGSLPSVVPGGMNPWRKAGKAITKAMLSRMVQLPKGFTPEKFLRDTDRYFSYMSKSKPRISAQAYIAFAEGDSFTRGFRKKSGLWDEYFRNECVISVFKTDNHYFISEIDELMKKMEGGGVHE